MYLTERFIFGGTLSALGGASGGSYHGSPGTVFVNVTVGEEPYRLLQIDNNNRGTLPVTLAETNTAFYEFERVHLVRQGTLNLKQVRPAFILENIRFWPSQTIKYLHPKSCWERAVIILVKHNTHRETNEKKKKKKKTT